MKPIDVLRSLDAIFSNADIYPPLMREVEPGRWIGDVSDAEYVVVEWRDSEFVGICYDGHQFGTLNALMEDLETIHRQFHNEKKYRAEEILPDRIIMMDTDY